MGLRDYGLCVLLAGGMLLMPSVGTAQRPRFSVGAPIAIAAGNPGPQAVTVGDVNKDGRNDIVVVSIDEEDGPIAVLINQGDGVFSVPRFVADEESVLGDPVAIALADVGAVSGGPDGNPDIIVIDLDGGFLVAFGDGAGNFAIEGDLTELDGLDAPTGVAVADFDGQNGLDLAILDEEGADDNGEIFFLCNVGQVGLFEPCISAVLDSRGEFPIDVGSGDFNGDGRTDVVVLNQGGAAGEGSVALFVGQGDGRFSVPLQPTFAITNEPRDLVVADLNAAEDSIDDVAVAEFEVLSDDNVTILLGGTGQSIFTRPGRALLEIGTTAIAAGKFTVDDNADLVGGNDPDQVGSSIIAIAPGDGTGRFQDPQIGSLLSGGALALAAGRLNDDELEDLVALNLAATELRVVLNTFDPSTPTLTSTATQVPTRTATATPSGTAPPPSPSPTSTTVVTSTPVIADDDSCSIVAVAGVPPDRSGLLFLGAAVITLLRRGARRRSGLRDQNRT